MQLSLGVNTIVFTVSFSALLDHGLVFEYRPELADDVGQKDVIGVAGYHAEDEDAVISEVLVRKSTHQLLILLPVDLVQQLQVLLDVGHPSGEEQDPPNPEQEVAAGAGSDEDKPEPEEYEDFFIKHVDWQDTLDGVGLDILELSDLKVTVCDFWEARRITPGMIICQSIQDLKTIKIVPVSHERVQKKKLSNDIDNIEDLHKYIKAGDVHSIPLGTEETKESRSLLPQSYQDIPTILPMCFQPSVHVQRNVANGLLSLLR